MKRSLIRCLSAAAIALMIVSATSHDAQAATWKNNINSQTGPGATCEWIQDENGWWAKRQDGTYPISTWMKDGNTWYHFDDRGYMQTGWITDGGATYYLKDSGAMAVNESLDIAGKTYAFDASGAANVTYKQLVTVVPEDQKSDTNKELDAMCDQILSSIINDTMNERQKAEAIYAWIRGNIHYAGQEIGTDWVESGYTGLIRRRGNCFTYCSVSNALLTRAGFSVINVVRSSDNGHWWNLVDVDGAWYHFDTTPRNAGGYFCLWTDAQMDSYSNIHGGCFTRDRSLYPPTP